MFGFVTLANSSALMLSRSNWGTGPISLKSIGEPMRETISHQKARSIAGEYYNLVKEGSEFPIDDNRSLVWNGSFFYIRTDAS